MAFKQAYWYLLNLDLFQAVPPEEIQSLADATEVLPIHRRESVLLDDASGCVHVVASGCLKLSRTSFLGRRLMDGVLNPGDVFGRISGADGTAYTVEALEDTRLLHISRDQFNGLIGRQAGFAFRVVQLLEERDRRMERRIESLVFKDVRTRLLETLMDLCRDYGEKCVHGYAVDIRITQQDLADLVGASRQMVNKILRELVLKRVLARKQGGRLLCILSIQKLAALADMPVPDLVLA
ncbi:MAG: Crp/Fnr family transcriptional regulator [Deltaproteobacteria bacterium]|nr:Crp/Fnr family transcriptional regulator [Deltaproteobacteria bacterium]